MKNLSRHIVTSGGFYLTALLIADAFNYIFSAYLNRVLPFEEIGLVTLINTLFTFVSLFITATATTVTHETAYVGGRDKNAAIAFYKSTFKKSLIVTLGVSVIWVLLVSFISDFFGIDRWMPLFLFTPMITVSLLTASNRGYLQGMLSFSAVCIFLIFETLSKLLLALVLVFFKLNDYVYISIIFSELFDFALAMGYVWYKTRNITVKNTVKFPIRFFSASVIAKLATTSFLIFDFIMAKHFLSPVQAGQYPVLPFAGQMVFYFGSLLNRFVVSLISRAVGLNQSPEKVFYKLFGGAVLLTFGVYFFVGPLGYFIMPLLFGKNAQAIVSFLPLYGLAIALFTLTNQLVTYHLARKHFIFPVTALFSAVLIVGGIILFHGNISQIVTVVFVSSLINFALLMVFHVFNVEGKYLRQNLLDLLELLLPLAKDTSEKKYKQRILIFNWRDLRHIFAGGAEVYVHEMAKRWVKAGNRVTVFCGNDGTSPRQEVIDGVEIIRRGGFYFVYIWAFVYYVLRFRNRYDIIIDSENGIPFFTPLYARKEKIFCLVHHVHQEIFQNYLIKPLAMFASFLEKDAMPFVYKNVKFITVSESTKQEMGKIGMGKAGIEIIYNGVDIIQMKPGKKNKNPMILYLGRLRAYKSVDVFIRTMPKILDKFPNTEFVIAGDGDYLHELKKLAKKLNLFEKINFIGKVTEEKKLDLYQRAWVFVNPSQMEGWGITTIEANACGTPVVA